MPKIDYRDDEGNKLPSVTQVENAVLGFNKGALMGWAYNQGKEGKPLYEARDKAADIGTLVHLMIQYDLLGKVYDTSNYPIDIVDKAENAFIGWLDYKKLVDFKLLETELSLVDSKMGFGGTMDKVSVKNKRSITDFKTGKGPYIDQWIQLSAYRHLWNLNYPKEPIDGGCYLLLINKEDGGFIHAHKFDLDRHFQIFKHALAIYKLHKELK